MLKPTDIPLIITSTNSSPETNRRRSLLPEPTESRKLSVDGRFDRKQRNIGGSLKYDIGRDNSVSNLIGFPAKWSSVRIKGTGFEDSRKSVVKIEPCNGIPNIGLAKKEYESLISPSQSHTKPHIGNVSAFAFLNVLDARFVH